MMSTIRAKQIIACYGGRFEQWPVDERQALQSLLLLNPELLSESQQQALQLDKKLEQLFATLPKNETKQLEQKILQSLPDRCVNVPLQTIRKKSGASQCAKFKDFITWFISPVSTMSAIALLLLLVTSLDYFNNHHNYAIPVSSDLEDELLMMAESLDNSYELELFAILTPELFENDLDSL